MMIKSVTENVVADVLGQDRSVGQEHLQAIIEQVGW